MAVEHSKQYRLLLRNNNLYMHPRELCVLHYFLKEEILLNLNIRLILEILGILTFLYILKVSLGNEHLIIRLLASGIMELVVPRVQIREITSIF